MAPRPRASLEGDTIFQVGDEEQWSDGEMSDNEDGKITRKISA